MSLSSDFVLIEFFFTCQMDFVCGGCGGAVVAVVATKDYVCFWFWQRLGILTEGESTVQLISSRS